MTLRESFDNHVSKIDDNAFADLFLRRRLSWDKIWDMISNRNWSANNRHDFDFNWGEMCAIYNPEKEDEFYIWFVEGNWKK